MKKIVIMSFLGALVALSANSGGHGHGGQGGYKGGLNPEMQACMQAAKTQEDRMACKNQFRKSGS